MKIKPEEMTEEKAREAVSALWRNHPSGASTFHRCATGGCDHGARDFLCDLCIIDQFEGNKGRLGAVLLAIQTLRGCESALVEGEI